MRKLHGAASLLLAIVLPVAAQAAQAAPPAADTSTPPPPAASAPSDSASGSTASQPAATASATAQVAAGQPVKDKTGATIGEVTDVKPSPGGDKQLAVIKMGDQSFAVDTAALVVQNGSATINASKSELLAMISQSATSK